MVRTLETNHIRERKSVRNYIVGSIAAIALAGAGLFYYNRTGNIQNDISTIIDSARPSVPGTIDSRFNAALSELCADKAALDRNYVLLMETVEKELQNKPVYSNRLIRNSLDSITRADAQVEKETYLAMFQRIRDKAEQSPEITDYLGDNAKAYMEKKFAAKYLGTVEDAFNDTYSTIKEKGKPIVDTLDMAKEYVLKKLKEAKK
jgi:hypothetical protein